MVRRTAVVFFSLAGHVALAAFVAPAQADEPVRAHEPSLMSEPGEVVDVVDALDTKNNDPFDLYLTLGFHQSWESGKVRRESNLGPNDKPSNAGFVANIENVAAYSHKVSTLNFRADIGIFRDFGFFFRVPLIIADDRSMDDLDGSTPGVNKPFGTISDPSNGSSMFKLPFKAPTRSGVDFIAVGLRWGIFNQFRDRSKPTWTIEVEGRFGVGTPLAACNGSPEAVSDAVKKATGVNTNAQCPDPDAAFVAASGTGWARDPRAASKSPGISRGTNAVRIGSVTSYRYRYVEPYGGFWFMAEFQKKGTAFGDYSGLDGIRNNHPPLQGGLTGGIMIHPWENREAHQRFSIDLRSTLRYVSEGRDYSPLFDALGSSNAPSLVAPNPSKYRDEGGKSVGDFNRSTIPFTGVTDVESYGVYGASLGFLMQAAQYIRFNAGFGVSYVQAHNLTVADPCNPDSSPTAGEAGLCKATTASGATTVTGAPNPNYRAVIDTPGRRLRVAESFLWDLWISGTVMF